MLVCPCCKKEIDGQTARLCPYCNLDLCDLDDGNQAREYASDVIIKYEVISFFKMPGCITLEEAQKSGYRFPDQSKPSSRVNCKKERRHLIKKKSYLPHELRRREIIRTNILLGWTGAHRKMIGDISGARLFFIFGVIGGVFTCGLTTIAAEAIALYDLYKMLRESGSAETGESGAKSDTDNDCPKEMVGEQK